MKVDTEFKNTDVNVDKTSEALDKIITIIREAHLSISELVILYSNLGYSLGASIDGFKGEGPPLEELEKKYYSEPTIGVAMMLQALTTSTWIETLEKFKEKR